MNTRDRSFKILVGVGLDERTPQLVTFVRNYAAYLNATVRLTHGIHHGDNYYWVHSYYGGSAYEQIFAEQKREAMARVKGQLTKLSSSLDGIQVETHFALGLPEDVLLGDAAATHADLIVVGTNADRTRFYPTGLSTSLSLMAHAPVPVMAVPDGVQGIPLGRRLKVLLADDLMEHSLASIHAAFELVSPWRDVDLFHVHFCEATKEDLKRVGESVLRLMNADKLPFDHQATKGDFLAQAGKVLTERLTWRTNSLRHEHRDAGTEYATRVYFGDRGEGLSQAIAETKPDILVFGRHRTLHRKPFGIGKFPFSAMLRHHLPVIVVPSK